MKVESGRCGKKELPTRELPGVGTRWQLLLCICVGSRQGLRQKLEAEARLQLDGTTAKGPRAPGDFAKGRIGDDLVDLVNIQI